MSDSNSCLINAEDIVDLLESVLCSALDINILSVWSQNDDVKHLGVIFTDFEGTLRMTAQMNQTEEV